MLATRMADAVALVTTDAFASLGAFHYRISPGRPPTARSGAAAYRERSSSSRWR